MINFSSLIPQYKFLLSYRSSSRLDKLINLIMTIFETHKSYNLNLSNTFILFDTHIQNNIHIRFKVSIMDKRKRFRRFLVSREGYEREKRNERKFVEDQVEDSSIPSLVHNWSAKTLSEETFGLIYFTCSSFST